MSPVFQTPVLLVEVWVIPELLYHVIVVCFAIVGLAGVKIFPAIAIVNEVESAGGG